MSHFSASASPDGSSPGAAAPGAAALQQMLLAQQQMLHQLQQQQQQQQPAPTLDINALAMLLQQQQAAMQQQQLQASAQLLSLQALGALHTFTGKGASTGLAAIEWLQQAERYFAAREAALGVNSAQADASRVVLAANALQDDALRWYNALPSQSRPTTWAAFREALQGRYSSVPAVRVRLEQLRSFVDAGRRLREKMTLEGLQGYTARFQQLAAEIPDSHLTAHGKLELLARGLAPRLAEVVLAEDARDAPAELHEVVKKVLAKAAFKEYAASQGGSAAASSSSSAGSAMELDAISLCATQFGISRDEAARYVEPSEGWAPHETSGSSASPPASSPFPAGGSPGPGDHHEQIERLLNAFAARFGGASNGQPGKGQSQRRNVPSGMRSDIPEALVKGRKEAGLCVKCGVAKYEPGGDGHNARTCKAAADKTTSVAEGKKKANF
jgi:hypothetical protein